MIFDGHILLTPLNDALTAYGYRAHRTESHKAQIIYSLWSHFLHLKLYVP